MKAGEDFGRLGDSFGGWKRRAVDQPDRQAELAGGLQFRFCAAAAGILGDDQIAAMGAQEGEVGGEVKGAARDLGCDAGQRQRVRRIDKAQEVVMLRLRGEFRDMQAPDGEEDATGGPVQTLHRLAQVAQMGPAVTRAGRPGRAHQADQRDGGGQGRFMGVMAHLRRERVGCVDQMRDPLRRHPCRKALCPAETSGSDRDRLCARVFGAARIGERGGDAAIRQQAGELACLGGAAQDQKVRLHG